MKLSSLTDLELKKIARPIYLGIIRGSNSGDYSMFSHNFSEELLARITPERFASQRKEFPLLSSISENFVFIGCIRRELGVSVLWKLESMDLKGEFLGAVTLQEVGGRVRVSGVAAH
jgi:hypothetical protein